MVTEVVIRIASLKELYAMLEQYRRPERMAVIACSSYPVREEALQGVYAKLILQFDDTTDSGRTTAFTPKMANMAAEFLDSLGNSVQELYICCDGGQSRSAAIAAAVSRAYGRRDTPIWRNPHYRPNPFIYRLQCNALGIKVTSFGLKWRILINKNAFRHNQY
jgi:predicted protein tyrosine phosphatase